MRIGNPTKIRNLIEREKHSKNSPYKNIPITKAELNVIRTLRKPDLIKLMFVILVLSKCNTYGNVPCDDVEIAKIAGVKKWKREIGEMLQPYVSEDDEEKGYLLKFRFIPYRNEYRPYYQVLFSKTKKRNGKAGRVAKPYLIIEDVDTCIDELIEKTDMFQTVCHNCGEYFFNVNVRRFYCDKCKKKIKKIKDRQWIRQKRYQQYLERQKIKAQQLIEAAKQAKEQSRKQKEEKLNTVETFSKESL